MHNFAKLASAAALVLAATPALAAPYTAPSAPGTATVRLYDAIELEKVEDIDFGTVIRDASFTGTGTIAMVAAGTTDCAAQTGLSCTGSTSAGHFTIKGDDGSDMSVSFNSGDYNPVTNVLKLMNGTESVDLELAFSGMSQDQAITGYDASNNPVFGDNLNTFSVSGTGVATDIKLFGTLSFDDANSNGVYSSSFTLTADYK